MNNTSGFAPYLVSRRVAALAISLSLLVSSASPLPGCSWSSTGAASAAADQNNSAAVEERLATAKKLEADNNLTQAESILKEAVATTRSGAPNQSILALNALAGFYKRRSRLAEAEQNYELARAIVRKPLPYQQVFADVFFNYADLCELKKDQAKQSALYDEGLALERRALGIDNQQFCKDLEMVALFYYDHKNLEKAATLYEEYLTSTTPSEAALEAVARRLRDLSEDLRAENKFETCERTLKLVVAFYHKNPKRKRLSLAVALNNLCTALMDQEKWFEAQSPAQECLQIFTEEKGAEDPDTLRAKKHLAMVYENVGRTDDADRMEFEVLKERERVLDPDNPSIATSLSNCSVTLVRRKQYDQAIAFLRRAVAIRTKSQGAEDPHTLQSKGALAGVLMDKVSSLTPAQKAQSTALLAEAKQLLEDSLAVSNKKFGPQHPSTQYLQGQLAVLYNYFEHGDVKSEDISRQRQKGLQATFGVSSGNVRARLLTRADQYWKRVIFDRMQLRHKEWLTGPFAEAMSEENKGNLDGAVATITAQLPKATQAKPYELAARWLLGDLLCRKGEYAKADAMYAQALKLASDLKKTLYEAAVLQTSTMNKQLAGEDLNYIEAYTKVRTLLGKDYLGVTDNTLNVLNVAICEAHLEAPGQGDLADAWHSWTELRSIKPDASPIVACDFDVSMAYAYLMLRHSSKGDTYKEPINHAVSLIDANVSSPRANVQRYVEVCELLCESSDYGRAQQLLAAAIAQSEQLKDNNLKCECVLLSARIAISQGDYSQAVALSEKAMQLTSEKDSPLQFVRCLEYFCAAASRAVVVSNNPRLTARAIDSAKKALQIQEQLKRPVASRAQLHINIGRLYELQGKRVEATSELQQAIALCRNQHDADGTLALADAFTELAVLQFLSKDYSASRESLTKATQIHNLDRSEMAAANRIRDLDLLSLIDAARGDKASAESEILASAAQLDHYIKNVLPELSLAEQRAFLDTISDTATVLGSVCQSPQAVVKAYPFQLRWKGLLVEGLRRQSQLGDAAKDKRYEKVVADLQNVRRQIASASRGSESTDKIAALNQEKEGLERQLPGLQDPAAGMDLKAFQNLLDTNEAVVDLQIYRNVSDNKLHYGVVITGKSAPPQFVALADVDKVNKALRDWRNSGIFASMSRDVTVLENNGTVAKSSSEESHEAWDFLQSSIWNPVQRALPTGATHLFICEDGELSRLPWSMFNTVDGAKNDLLMCSIDSPRELISLKKSSKSNSKNSLPVLIAGAIKYKDARLDLQGAAQEVSEIQQIAEKNGLTTNTLTSQQPTRSAVIKNLSNSGIVHLATHGFFQGGGPSASENTRGFGTRAMTISGAENAAMVAARNPLVRSGVLLACPTGDTGKDEARLTAEELIGIDMSKCDLLTLSACDTGRGEEVSGQGVMGLRSAIMAGGARSVLLSLWPVDDEATRALMRQFYTNLWSKKMNKAEALKQAQLAIKNDAQHPSWKRPVYWSGWQLVGEGWK